MVWGPGKPHQGAYSPERSVGEHLSILQASGANKEVINPEVTFGTDHMQISSWKTDETESDAKFNRWQEAVPSFILGLAFPSSPLSPA